MSPADVEAAQAEARFGDWAIQSLEQLNALEARLGRPLTDAESETIITDMAAAPSDGTDATDTYLDFYDVDRTRDEDDRKDLMGEIMDEETARAEEAEGQGEGEGFEDYEQVAE